MSEKHRPDWWPTNPYFPSIFTMSEDDIVRAIPDELRRTGVAGKLMHDAWELASAAIWEHFKANAIPAREHIMPIDTSQSFSYELLALQRIRNAAYFIEMQRRLDNMEGDSNIVNALQSLCDAVEALAAHIREDEEGGVA